MSSYLADELAKLGVDDQAIIDYCVGLLDDDTLSLSDKAEMIVGYLDPSTDSATIEALLTHAHTLTEELKQKQQAQSAETAQAELAQALAREKQELQRDALEQVKQPARELTAEERRQRDKLIAAYEYRSAEIVERADGEAELVVLHDDGDKAADAGLQRNSNAQAVAEKERMARESSRAAHQKKVEREKELLEADRLRKEKEKRRTMKKEKRRM
ncbi:hypothetical protein GGI15_004445 [Coemansia interrupta]|uniref:Coiled-coil domain-containing protein 43 n=1 Tax=Coemansia interrupta TaxID=1126814 RepID=A0A9W8H4C1_9FUNG|nr:hypothetical protein GGI15_004445 [Coemansia interrupta]